MSELEKAARDAVEAQDNAQQLALITAILQAQALTQQPPVPAPVQQPSGGTGKWLAIGAGASIFLLTVAISAMAVALSAVALTICVLVLRSMWRDFQKGR